MRIPFFDMAAELAAVRADVDRAIARVLDSGVFIGGPEVEGFERELAVATGARFAIGTSSGTDALLAIGMALGWRPGVEVVTTPFTFFATVGAIVRLGAVPVFADIDDERMTLDPAAAVDAVGPKTAAVMPVHLFGLRAAHPSVSCVVVEDAAQSIGSGPVRGAAAALSFFPTKNLGAVGDAGAVLTDDPALAERIALVRSHGARPKYHHLVVGGNFRLDAIQAAVLRAKLPHLERWTAARRAHAARYRVAFAAADLAEVKVPVDDPAHAYHQFVIRASARERLRAHLTANGIGTEVYYPELLHHAPALVGIPYRAGACPHAEAACAEVLALPVHPALPRDAPERVVEAVRGFYRG
ncbi:MAG: DegT/DnrJ/EryC1/StrS family aminotransferase [Deltaproteobacteria bacterium]|nr:DegT/DnrJ/EryC1/StrS family aminotransferase [Kofleriaceae bacterium]